MCSRRAALPLTASLMVTAAVCGCSSGDEMAFAAVHGQVLLRGQPLADAMVVFHPLEGDAAVTAVASKAGQSLPKPMAHTDSEGRFILTTNRPGDGAPPGRYAVTVELRKVRLIGEEEVRDGPNLLPAKYSRPETTPLRYQVTDGLNDVPTLSIE